MIGAKLNISYRLVRRLEGEADDKERRESGEEGVWGVNWREGKWYDRAS